VYGFAKSGTASKSLLIRLTIFLSPGGHATVEKLGPLIGDSPQLEHLLGGVNQASELAGQKGGIFTALFTGAGRMSSFSKESEAPP
jgi:hypothetical protein